MDIESNNDNINNENKDYVIGIDLGTQFSCVSVWRNKRFEIISDQFGNRTIPSIVSFYRSAKLVGYNALALKDVNPRSTIYDIKRIIGRRMDDPKIDNIKKLLTYNLIDDQSDHHNILVQLDKNDINLRHKTTFKPEEICAYILIEIKKMASNYLHNDVKKAIITVPVYFNDAQRQATLDSAKIAGLDVLRIINEPTAAALAYGLGNKQWKKNNSNNGGNVIIYDFGAGTLDISLMNISNGVFKTLAISGSSHLGGRDIDYLMMNYVIMKFKKENRIKDLQISKLSEIKLKNAVENAKKILSVNDKAVICVDNFYDGKKLYQTMSRELFEIIANEVFLMCIKHLQDIFEGISLEPKDIDEVILVGGSTRIPKLQELILKFFNNTNVKQLSMSFNPDEVVSAGASIYGYIMAHNEDPFSQNVVLLDITPLSLGVETLRKQMTVIIPRNTVIPTRKTKVFSTDTDNQNSVSIKIFEGERKLTKDNFHVGTFDLCGFEKGPKGYPTIKITFHIDINGILQVTAHEKKSDVQNSIQITSTWGAKGRLSKEDIDKIIEDAEKNDHIDTIYSLKVGLVHKINTICSTVLFNIKNDSFNLTKEDKIKIKKNIKNHLSWLKKKELYELHVDELKKKEEWLSKHYAPLIIQIDKNSNSLKELKTITNSSNNAEIYGDDDYTELESQQCPISKSIDLNDISDYEKDEIKAIKKTIMDLGKNIMSVVNNPVSKFTEEDINLINDYIGSVHIWLYTTTASTTIEYIAKINEINKFTEEIMKKYEEVFTKNEQFTVRDELQLTCLTLNTAFRSNFFTLEKQDADKLRKVINDNMLWLVEHQYEDEAVYRQKIDELSDLCNSIHNGMHRLKFLDNIKEKNNEDKSKVDNDDDDDDESNDDTDEDDITLQTSSNNRIDEKIDLLLDTLPDKPIRKNISKNYVFYDEKTSKQLSSKERNNSDVLLRIDINKLNSKKSYQRNNVNIHHES